MKRSDMIAIMVEAIFDEDYTANFHDHFADIVLKAMERKGMLPPDTECRGVDYNKPEWEPEEDEVRRTEGSDD